MIRTGLNHMVQIGPKVQHLIPPFAFNLHFHRRKRRIVDIDTTAFNAA